jgi:hypothetical protein
MECELKTGPFAGRTPKAERLVEASEVLKRSEFQAP